MFCSWALLEIISGWTCKTIFSSLCEIAFLGAKHPGQTRSAKNPGQSRGAKYRGQRRSAPNPGQTTNMPWKNSPCAKKPWPLELFLICSIVLSLTFGFPDAFEGPGGFKKLREACRVDIHLLSSRSELGVPSYHEQQKIETKNTATINEWTLGSSNKRTFLFDIETYMWS